MNPTTAATSLSSSLQSQADGSVVITLVADRHRPAVALDATIRHPAAVRAALAAFLKAVPGASPAPIVTVADDAWIIEGFAADQSAYARLSVPYGEFDTVHNVQIGTARVGLPPDQGDALGRVRLDGLTRLRLAESAAGPARVTTWPRGWVRGFAGIQAAQSLPTRRIALDRGGLFGLLTALGRSRTVRASRSIVVNWQPGKVTHALVQGVDRPVPLHAHAVAVAGEPSGSIRVAVGHGLTGLAELLPWVDAADLGLPGPGLPSFWSVRLGDIRLTLGLPCWTPDGRWGSLSLDPLIPPVDSAQRLADQVAATFRAHPSQTREQVVERSASNAPEVAAVLSRYASLGQILAEAETGLFRWRAAFGDAVPVLDDLEPAEVSAARAIVATRSVQINRDEVDPAGRWRRVEGTILDRPITLTLDPDGWLRQGRCACLDRREDLGPCRHLLALQAVAWAGSSLARNPPDLAAWWAGWPLPMPPG